MIRVCTTEEDNEVAREAERAYQARLAAARVIAQQIEDEIRRVQDSGQTPSRIEVSADVLKQLALLLNHEVAMPMDLPDMDKKWSVLGLPLVLVDSPQQP